MNEQHTESKQEQDYTTDNECQSYDMIDEFVNRLKNIDISELSSAIKALDGFRYREKDQK